jgi:hypothetical protein
MLLAFAFGAVVSAGAIDRAFERLYNFDFDGAHRIADDHIAKDASDPLGYAVRASGLLFQELHRLRILEAEFVSDDKKITDKRRRLQPDNSVRDAFFQSVQQIRTAADRRLASNANDPDAVFTLSLAAGLTGDYVALVEKRQWASLTHIKEAEQHAARLKQISPDYPDADLTTGICEYLLGSMPFFVRWFVRIDGVQGSKAEAMRKLQHVASGGRYLKPFAKILLAIVNLREKQPLKSQELLSELSRDFPQNPLFRNELSKLSARLDGQAAR